MKLKRYLSFALAAIMTLSMSLIPVSAQSEIQYTSADLPEMLSYNDAVSAGHVNRLTAEEELNTLVFANSDNTKTMYYFSENIKYVDESGDICYKTNDLTYSSGAYINAENDINVSLPLTLSSGVTLAYEDILISMTPNVTGSSSVSDSISASAVFNSASNNQSDSVSYQSVFGVGTAVRYTPLYSGIKEDIILSSYTGVYSFNFLIETNGLLILPESTISDDDSMISGNASELSEPTRWYFAYEDDTDTPVALISDIYIYDSVGAETKGSVSITPYIDDNYILTVTADRAFLESSSTVYPVTIDPTITINYNNSTIHDSSISSYLVTSNFGSDSYLNVGGSYNYYSALKFQGLTNNSVFSSLSAGQIYSSTLNMYCYSKSGTNMSVTVSQYSPNSITSGYWTEGTITYSKCGVEVNEVDEVNAVTKTITSAVPYSFDITAIVKKWKSTSNLIEQGLLISPSDSSSSAMAVFASSEYSTASLRPYLTINYVCNGIYKIVNVGSEKNLNAYNSRGDIGDNIYQYTNDGTAAQAFRLVYNSGSNSYTIYTICNEYGYGNIVASSNNNVQIAASSNGAKWVIQHISDDNYKIKLYGSSMYMTVGNSSNGSNSNTAVSATGNVYLAASSSSNYQKWHFELIDDDGCVELSGIELHTQEVGNTCSSACIKMVLGYYGITKTETEICQYQKSISESEWIFAWVIRNTINNYLSSDIYESPSFASSECKYYRILMSLKNGNPVIIGIRLDTETYPYTCGSSGHYVVISGIINTSNGLYFKVYDPYLLYNSSKTYNETIPEDNILLVSVDTLFGCMNSGNNIIISSEKNY